jgi:hypothetical protein
MTGFSANPLKTRLNTLMWDSEDSFYYNLDEDERRIKVKTIAVAQRMLGGFCWYFNYTEELTMSPRRILKLLREELVPANQQNLDLLLDIIDLTISDSERLGWQSYFCKTGSAITAFVAYIEDGSYIRNIKTFSLLGSRRQNTTLVRDLIRFIHEQLLTHDVVQWDAVKQNPAVVQYNETAPLFGLQITFDPKQGLDQDIPELRHPDWPYMYAYVLHRERYTPELQAKVQRYLR